MAEPAARTRSIRWCSSTPCGSRSATRAWSRTKPSTWRSRWREGRSRGVDRAVRRRQVLAQGGQRAQAPRRQRHPHCGGRRAQGLSGSDHVRFPANRGSDLHRARNSLAVSWKDRKAILPAIKAIYPAENATWRSSGSRARGRMGQATSGDWPGLVPRLGACRPGLRVRAQHPQDDLNQQRSRGAASVVAQDHQDPRQLPKR